MKLNTYELINLALAEDIQRLSQAFIHQAIKDWNDHGEGCFALFVQLYVYRCWRRLARLN